MTKHETELAKRSATRVRQILLGLFCASVVIWAGCGDTGPNGVTTIDATGMVRGLVYFDGNGSREFEDSSDAPLAGVDVALILAGVSDTVRVVPSSQTGEYTFSGVPVGNYRVVVDTNTIGDSVVVVRIAPTSDIGVAPNDTIEVSIALSFPIVTSAQARTAPLGLKVFIEGVALNHSDTFGDSTIHVADTSGAIRAVRSGSGPAVAGDSVRVRGTIATRNDQRVLDLDRSTPIVLAKAELPVQDTVTTTVAADANGGSLDAALVRIDSVRITDTVTANGDLVTTVNDGSGAVDMVLDGDIGFNLGPFLAPGAYVKVTGLLVPDGSGAWMLKPRADTDVELVVPVMSIAEARTQPVGEIVFVDGVVLNHRSTFGDSSVHIHDVSASVRGTGVRTVPVFAGDSVRFVGIVQIQRGQPVIAGATVFRWGQTEVPVPVSVTTAVAGSANGGLLDAALVAIDSARISDTATVNADYVVTIDDGSGELEVVLDGDVGFNLGQYLLPGAYLKVTGLLVPTGAGDWQLKPRSNTDAEVVVSVLPISQARTRPVGEIVFVEGIVLNAWSTFADSTVHMSDISGSVRAVRVRPPAFPVILRSGDNARFVGTMAVKDGQPVIDDVTVFKFGQAGEPAAVTLFTAEASSARNGTLDAAMISLRSGTITNTGAVGRDFHLTVDDGSGPVVIVLDGDIWSGADLAPFVPGAVFDFVIGLLVPSGTGTWVVKPRDRFDAIVIVL